MAVFENKFESNYGLLLIIMSSLLFKYSKTTKRYKNTMFILVTHNMATICAFLLNTML